MPWRKVDHFCHHWERSVAWGDVRQALHTYLVPFRVLMIHCVLARSLGAIIFRAHEMEACLRVFTCRAFRLNIISLKDYRNR